MWVKQHVALVPPAHVRVSATATVKPTAPTTRSWIASVVSCLQVWCTTWWCGCVWVRAEAQCKMFPVHWLLPRERVVCVGEPPTTQTPMGCVPMQGQHGEWRHLKGSGGRTRGEPGLAVSAHKVCTSQPELVVWGGCSFQGR
jgi:hypothetical protein